MNIADVILKKATLAKNASSSLVVINNENKNNVLNAIAEIIEKNIDEVLFRNSIDVEAAKSVGLSESLIDRLTLTEERLRQLANSVREITKLDDPIGEILESFVNRSGLLIEKKRVPFGVIGVIYESRPNVTIDTIALCVKSGNSVILKGGSETLNSNMILSELAIKAAMEKGWPSGAIEFIDTSNREAVNELLKLDKLVDVIIPRGSQAMIDSIVANSKIPVIKHGKGLCHVYVDEFADLEMATKIVINAKVSRPGVCNALETLLVNKTIAQSFLSELTRKLDAEKIELRGCPESFRILKDANIKIKLATEKDWDEEYLDKILAIKIVENFSDALLHIKKHGTSHSEAIVTENKEIAERFLLEVDAASVYHNASTRFTDGGEFGLGAEIGISTQKLHARGPMGIKELTSYKYVIRGTGQVRK